MTEYINDPSGREAKWIKIKEEFINESLLLRQEF